MPAVDGGPSASDQALLPASPARSRAFPGRDRELATVRRWLESLLPVCPARDDLILVASELAGNAVVHTASGQGGWFTAEVSWHGSAVRLAVRDGGSLTEPTLIDDPEAEWGRGLRLVRALSRRTGVEGDRRGRRIWAVLDWDGPAPDWSKPCNVPGEVCQPRPTGRALPRRPHVP